MDLSIIDSTETKLQFDYNIYNKTAKVIKYSSENDGLEDILIPDFVIIEKIKCQIVSIEKEAFKDCRNIKSVKISDFVFEIGYEAFSGCTNLICVHLPIHINIIPFYLFRGCYNLKEVNIPKNVLTIETGAFENCNLLSNIDFPESLVKIEENAFRECRCLRDIILNEGLLFIENYAFQGCISLSNIVIPHSVLEIGAYAFSDCCLDSIKIQNTKINIDDECFRHGNDNILLIIPFEKMGEGYIDCMPYEQTGEYWVGDDILPSFSQKSRNICPDLTNLPYEVIMSDEEHKSNLFPTYVDNYGGKYKFGVQVFEKIERKIYKNDNTYIINEHTKFLADCAFANDYVTRNSQYEDIILPQGLKGIGKHCFENSCVKNVVLPDSLEYIGDFAFRDCYGLKEFIIPSSVKHIGVGLFSEHEHKYSVIWEIEKVISYSQYYRVENNCIIDNRTNGVITFIQKYIRESNFYNIEKCRIPEGVLLIGKYAFSGMHMDNISLPDTLLIIDEYAFENCAIIDIKIPSSVIHINDFAFSGCDSLKEITFSNEYTMISKKAFIGCNSLVKINVPHGCKEKYSNQIPDLADMIIDIG